MNRKLSAAEMGERDGLRLKQRSGPFDAIHGPAVARVSGERHLAHVATKRLSIADVGDYCTAFLKAALS